MTTPAFVADEYNRVVAENERLRVVLRDLIHRNPTHDNCGAHCVWWNAIKALERRP